MFEMHEKLSPNSWKEKLPIIHFSFSNYLEILCYNQNYFRNLNYFKLHELKVITLDHITGDHFYRSFKTIPDDSCFLKLSAVKEYKICTSQLRSDFTIISQFDYSLN